MPKSSICPHCGQPAINRQVDDGTGQIQNLRVCCLLAVACASPEDRARALSANLQLVDLTGSVHNAELLEEARPMMYIPRVEINGQLWQAFQVACRQIAWFSVAVVDGELELMEMTAAEFNRARLEERMGE